MVLNYATIIKKSFKHLEKLHCLYSHFEYFLENFVERTKEQRERIH